MRIIIAVLIFLTLSSCREKAVENKRPVDQIRFVNVVKELRDTVNAAEKNKVLRNHLLENGVPALKTYIKDTLKLKFNAWQARVLDISDNYPNSAAIEVKFGIPLDPANTTNQASYQSIVLSSIVNQTNEGIITIIKQLKAGDQVKINGEFIEKKGFIDIDSYSRYKFSKNVFDNPEFKTLITAVEKL